MRMQGKVVGVGFYLERTMGLNGVQAVRLDKRVSGLAMAMPPIVAKVALIWGNV